MREPGALFIDDEALERTAEQLASERFLGKVDIRGDRAYRLTEFGRAAIGSDHELAGVLEA